MIVEVTDHSGVSRIINYIKGNVLQGWVQFPTGGEAVFPERKTDESATRHRRLIRLESGTDSTVWMEEE